MRYFEENGWTCDDCKSCIVCELSPSESEKSGDEDFCLGGGGQVFFETELIQLKIIW